MWAREVFAEAAPDPRTKPTLSTPPLYAELSLPVAHEPKDRLPEVTVTDLAHAMTATGLYIVATWTLPGQARDEGTTRTFWRPSTFVDYLRAAAADQQTLVEVHTRIAEWGDHTDDDGTVRAHAKDPNDDTG